MEEKRTANEALATALKVQRDLSAPGSDWTKLANHIVAKNVLDTDLGRYADSPPAYHLDQETRDRLLAHARQDAAEALCHTRSLMDEVHQLKNSMKGLKFSLWVLVALFFLEVWWKSGFVPWWK